jgi:cell surface protein SprA
LNSSLIRGAKFVWGKTQLQFGKIPLRVFFQNKITNKKSVVAQGGGTIQDFDVFALDHDSDRHFFISILRNKYDASLKTIRLLIVEFKYQARNLGYQ